jgi:WD40 repeat protein
MQSIFNFVEELSLRLTFTARPHAMCGCTVSPKGDLLLTRSRFDESKPLLFQDPRKLLQFWRVTDPGAGEKHLGAFGLREPTCCAFDESGGRVVSGHADGNIRLWDTLTGKMLARVSEGSGGVVSVQFSGETILAGVASPTHLTMWIPKTTWPYLDSRRIHSRHLEDPQTSTTFTCSCFVDGGTILTGSDDCTLRVWDVASGQSQVTFQGHLTSIRGCAAPKNGGAVLSWCQHVAFFDPELANISPILWCPFTGLALFALHGHMAPIITGQFSHDGSIVLTTSHDRTLRVWNAETGMAISTLQSHTVPFLALLSPDGETVVSEDQVRHSRGHNQLENGLKIWSAKSGNCRQFLVSHSPTCEGSFHPDSKTFSTIHKDERLRVWGI